MTLTKIRAAKARFNIYLFFYFFRFTLWLYNNTCITHDCISQIAYDFLFIDPVKVMNNHLGKSLNKGQNVIYTARLVDLQSIS